MKLDEIITADEKMKLARLIFNNTFNQLANELPQMPRTVAKPMAKPIATKVKPRAPKRAPMAPHRSHCLKLKQYQKRHHK